MQPTLFDRALEQRVMILEEALRQAKRHMWREAAPYWTMADFKNWAIVQQIDAALSGEYFDSTGRLPSLRAERSRAVDTAKASAPNNSEAAE